MMASRAEVQSDSFQDVGKAGGGAGGKEGEEAGGSSRPIKKPPANATPQVTIRIAQQPPSRRSFSGLVSGRAGAAAAVAARAASPAEGLG